MAAEMFCGAIVSTFVQMTIETLVSGSKDYILGTKLNKELLRELSSKLLCIDVLADDAEQKQFRDSRVRDWLLKAKHVLFDAEDLLAEIDVELSKCQVEADSNTIVGRVTSFFQSSFEIEMEWMEEILADIEDLLSQSVYLGLKRDRGVRVGSGSGSNESWKLSSTSLPSASVIYGRDDEKEEIINWLTSPTDNKLSILSIVGMGGLGKTTLAQLVYNDSKIQGKDVFDIKAWVCVSDEFDVLKVTRTILERITGSTDNSRDLEMVQTKLKENLSGKKFLLVLDDVWNEEWPKWEEVQKPLDAFGAQGSTILVTTRSNKVASTMRSKVHNLKLLPQDHCWQLFSERAFPGDNLPLNSYYKEIGMKIVEKCKGLPLALKSMGSLLHNKSSISEWQSVLESEVWQLSDNIIVPALALSYLHLPSHLKKCFAYCALFPKDYEFDKEDLTQLWKGEQFVLCNEHGRSPENVGEEIFNDLFSRSFVQQSSRKRDRFVMHDLINDLAKYVCGDICFRLGVDQIKGIPKATRHFSFSGHNFDGFGSLPDVERLHTFMPTYPPFDDGDGDEGLHFQMRIQELLPKFKFLRVLSLKSCRNLKEVPQSVGDLKHLCSLDLSNTRIYKLPESLCSLFNMQILKLNYCRKLTELPSNLHRLTKLHRLEFKGTIIRKVSPQLGELKNLQVCMSWFDVGESREFTPQQLGELNVHGSLSIKNLQNIENPSDALSMHLKNKTHLEELVLGWGHKRQVMNRNLDDSLKQREEIVIANLQPSKQLKKLSIRKYGGTKFPSWLSDNSLRNVVSLKLDSCESCQSLPSLGHLPFLKELGIANIDGIVSIDADFYGSEPFSFTSLETLKFCDMKEWERWECEGVTGAFPRLQHLFLWHCPKLKGNLPVQNLHLKELTISCCEQLETCAPKTSKLELKDSGKLQFNWADLKSLKMEGHKMEVSLVEMFGHNKPDTSLEELDIHCCPEVIRLNHYSNCLISDGYDPLKTFRLDFFPTLNTLRLTGFPDLQMISLERANNHLKFLRIENCPELESLPIGMDILQVLVIEDCPKVEWVPGGYLSSNLERMRLGNCSKLVISQKGAFGANPSLEYLMVSELDAENFPEEGLLPLSLTSLRLWNCKSLKKLEYKGLCHLSSLKELQIVNCPKLECLPEEGLPKSISSLTISGSELLRQRCKELTGEDWAKIAHIQDRFFY